jgi:hypothetical protein
MLTPAQKAILKTNIQANSDANTLYVDGNLDGLAALYNAGAAPAFIVWRSNVSRDEITQNGFDWVRVDNLSAGKARIWEWMFANTTASINPSKVNVRAGIDEAWKGTQADLDVRAAVYVHCKRSATRGEKLFATGTGSDAVPALLTFEGIVTAADLVNL